MQLDNHQLRHFRDKNCTAVGAPKNWIKLMQCDVDGPLIKQLRVWDDCE